MPLPSWSRYTIDAPAFLGDQLHGAVELHAAVAALRSEDVAGEALGVHPDEHVRLPRHLAEDQRHVLRPIHVVLVADDREVAELGRQPRLGHAVDQLLLLQPVGDQLRHRHEGEPWCCWRSPRGRAAAPSSRRR